MAHVGVYQGDGYVIHAKGHDYGVVRTRLSDDRWTHYGIPVGLYDEPYTRPTLRRGDQGEYVRIMQQYLVNDGYTLKPTKSAPDGCDGIFGADTEVTLIAYQAEHGIVPDGICGADTWTALECPEAPPVEPDVPETPDADLVTVDREQLMQIVKTARQLLGEIEALIGGMANG